VTPPSPLSSSSHLQSPAWHALALFVFFCAALFLRSYFAFDRVFTPEYVNFQENDPWYHVRAIEHLIENFPHRLTWDPYALHPGGQHVAVGPFFDWVAASIALVLGAGSPSLRLTHTVCAWLPAIWGALTVVPVYLLGRVLRDARTGLFAAATVAVLPGPFLRRSSLGYTDHHVAETFFTLLTILFLIRMVLPIAPAGNANPPASPLDKRGHRAVISARSAIYSLLCALSLGCYLLTWVGGSLLVLALSVALLIHVTVEHTRGRDVTAACAGTAAAWAIALLIVIPFRGISGFRYHIVALTASSVYFFLLGSWAWLIRRSHRRRVLFPSGLVALAIAGVVLLRLAKPNLLAGVMGSVSRFVAGAAGTFIIEARPLLYEGDAFTLRPTWEMFQITAFTAILGTGLLFYRVVRDRAPAGPVILVWTLGLVLATLTQERFAYYLAVNLAVLAGYFWGGLFEALKERWPTATPTPRLAWARVGVVLIFAIGLYPSMSMACAAGGRHTGPDRDWHDAMAWLRQNSAEPFDDPGFFQRDYDTDASTLPQAHYSIMCSWDYGYWVTALAHRVPTANPTQSGMGSAARFFAAQSEAEAADILTRLSARYVLTDATLPVWRRPNAEDLEGAFGTIARLGGHDEFELYEPYLEPKEDGAYKPIVLYYPEYYRSMLNRLYLFAGREYVPEWSTWAVRFSTLSTETGFQFKRIDQGLKFKTYDLAVKFLDEHPGEPWRIVGLSPVESCVPLEAVRHFQRVYQSPTQAPFTNARPMGMVEIFEFAE